MREVIWGESRKGYQIRDVSLGPVYMGWSVTGHSAGYEISPLNVRNLAISLLFHCYFTAIY
jgi:hypothetical protein